MPPRIVSLLASATEMICQLGLADHLVGISHECDFPPEVLDRPRITRTNLDDSAPSLAIDEEVRGKLARGEPLYSIGVEQLVALAPQLIVTQAQCDVCAVRHADVVEAVAGAPELAGCEVLALNPASLADVLDELLLVGAAAGCRERAARLRAELQRRIDRVSHATAGRPRPRVALVEWLDPPMLSGNWLVEMVEWAGGRHDLTEAGRPSPQVAWETLVDYDPEVVVLVPCGFDLARTLREAESLAARPGWSQLAAVRAGRVYAADGNAYFNRAGPRLVESLELLGHLLHPEAVDGPPEAAGAWKRIEAAGR